MGFLCFAGLWACENLLPCGKKMRFCEPMHKAQSRLLCPGEKLGPEKEKEDERERDEEQGGAGGGDVDSVDDAIMGYVQSYIRFRQESPNVFIPTDGIEKLVYNPTWNYAGTVDRICYVNQLNAIIDLKSGSPSRWHGLQLSGYSLALGGGFRRYGLYLKKDGRKATLIEYDDLSEDDVFLGITNFNHWNNKK